jgi:hypothetical protein
MLPNQGIPRPLPDRRSWLTAHPARSNFKNEISCRVFTQPGHITAAEELNLSVCFLQYSHSCPFSTILVQLSGICQRERDMHPLTTNKFLQTYDVYSFGFESAGTLEIVNEYSGLAVTPAHLYCFRRSQAACPTTAI